MFLRILKLFEKLIAVVFITMALASVVYSVPTRAAETNNGDALLTFAGCQIPKTSTEGSKVVLSCLSSITRFIFIIGIVAAGINFAVFTARSYIPGQSSETFKEAQETIRNMVIGMILIGAPASIIGIFNSGALSLDFLSTLNQIRENANKSLGGSNSNVANPIIPSETTNTTNNTNGGTTGNGTNTTGNTTTGTTGTGSGSGTSTSTSSSQSSTTTNNTSLVETSFKIDPSSIYYIPEYISSSNPNACQTITLKALPQNPKANESKSAKYLGIQVCKKAEDGFIANNYPFVITERQYGNDKMRYIISTDRAFTLSSIPYM